MRADQLQPGDSVAGVRVKSVVWAGYPATEVRVVFHGRTGWYSYAPFMVLDNVICDRDRGCDLIESMG